MSDAPTETRVFYMFLGMNHGPITVCRLLGSTIRRGIVHLYFSVAGGPGVTFCAKHRHAQLGTCSFALVWHGSRRHVYVCWHRFANEGTSPEPDVISCCAVIRTCEKVGTPGTYICRTRAGRPSPPSHPSPPSPSPSGSVWIQGGLGRKGVAQPKPTPVSRCDPPSPSRPLPPTRDAGSEIHSQLEQKGAPPPTPEFPTHAALLVSDPGAVPCRSASALGADGLMGGWSDGLMGPWGPLGVLGGS